MAKKEKSNVVVFELQKLNQSLIDFKDVISDSKDFSEIKTDLNISKKIDQLSSDIHQVNENILKLLEKKIPEPKVIVPNKVEVKNISDAKVEKVKIDWENKPKEKQEKIDTITPVNSIIEFIKLFFGSLISKILTYISEPDTVELSDNKIVENYGKRTITYQIIRDNEGKIKKVKRNES